MSIILDYCNVFRVYSVLKMKVKVHTIVIAPRFDVSEPVRYDAWCHVMAFWW